MILLFRKSQLPLLAGPRRVKHPGVRGGKFWLTRGGDVRYGARPQPSAGLDIPSSRRAVVFRSGASDVTTMAGYMAAERKKTIDLTDPNVQKELETYVPLIQQGKGAEVLL